MKAVCWHGKRDVRVETVPDPGDPEPARRHRAGDLDGDLRLGPPPLQRLHPDHAGRRHPRPRVHGRGGRGRRAASRNLARGRPRRGAVRHRLRRVLVLPARALVAVRQLEPERARWPRRSTASRAAGSSATRTSTAATPAARPSTCACRSPTSGRSRCPTTLDRRAGAVPDRHPADRLHGGGELRHPARRHRRRVGLRARSGSSRSAARSCSAPSASSRSTACRRGSRWPRRAAKAETLDYERTGDVVEELQAADRRARAGRLHRRGRHSRRTARAVDALYDRVKQAVRLGDRPAARAARRRIQACRKGGTVSIPGVYGGFLDKVPIGAAFAKGLTLRMGQTHVHRYLPPLLERIEAGEIDPELHHQPPAAASARARGLRDVQRQGGRVHQGGPEPVRR